LGWGKKFLSAELNLRIKIFRTLSARRESSALITAKMNLGFRGRGWSDKKKGAKRKPPKSEAKGEQDLKLKGKKGFDSGQEEKTHKHLDRDSDKNS